MFEFEREYIAKLKQDAKLAQQAAMPPPPETPKVEVEEVPEEAQEVSNEEETKPISPKPETEIPQPEEKEELPMEKIEEMPL